MARSGVLEVALHRLSPPITSVQGQIVVLVTAVTLLSAFIKNIGALAMMIPVAFQMARHSNTSPSSLLMPMAFGSLLGGLITLVGTSPNIIVSRVRQSGSPSVCLISPQSASALLRPVSCSWPSVTGFCPFAGPPLPWIRRSISQTT